MDVTNNLALCHIADLIQQLFGHCEPSVDCAGEVQGVSVYWERRTLDRGQVISVWYVPGRRRCANACVCLSSKQIRYRMVVKVLHMCSEVGGNQTSIEVHETVTHHIVLRSNWTPALPLRVCFGACPGPGLPQAVRCSTGQV